MIRPVKISIERYDDVIGLPRDHKVIVFTNSERTDAQCPRRWWFRHVEGLRVPATSAQRHGTMWHRVLETIHQWWRDTDSAWPVDGATMCPWCAVEAARAAAQGTMSFACEFCGGTRKGVIAQLADELADDNRKIEASGGYPMSQEDQDHAIETISRALEGWLRRYGWRPYESFVVAAVEVAVARLIQNPRTNFRAQLQIDIVRYGDSYRLAGTGEAAGATKVRWPWYQIGRLDCVLRHRQTGALWVGEWKSSASPERLIEGLSVDPQTAGYCWLLDQPHILARFGGSSVGGYLYDVSSSGFQYDPKMNKPKPTKAQPNPPVELSQAKNTTTPSWRYRAALVANGLNEADYREHLDYLEASVDPKLYVREHGSTSAESRARYGAEAYAEAVRFSVWRRGVAHATDQVDLDVAVPRVPVCRAPGGHCAYRGPCLQDGEEIRRNFQVGPGTTYTPKGTEPSK
ncbi:MAG: PD-(D/E)XK nuclease family protein [Chloroflexi bacterium]|nr:PD-(D/E)XK nuclease family protein [Chloroflexota bacterium]